MSNSSLLSGKIALITGAASGIGRASAVVFAQYGAKVALADIDTKGGEQTVEMVRKAGGEAIFVRTDVSKASEVEALVAKVVETWDRLDCALNNAGIEGAMAPIGDAAHSNWERVIAVNLTGVFYCMQYEVRQMLKRGGGSIVNTSSAAGLAGYPNVSAYVASKHGVVGLTRGTALEYAKLGIRVNAVCPGIVRTPMVDEILREGKIPEEALVGLQPVGRMGTPEEIAEAAAWMCSDRASFMTGQTVAVDGGYLAG